MKRIKYALLATISAFAVSANAVPIFTVDGGVSENISSLNDVLDPADYGVGDQYNVGGQLKFDQSYTAVQMTFTFLGKEAGWLNVLSAYGNTSLNANSTVGDSLTVSDWDTSDNGELVDFSFITASAGLNIVNGLNDLNAKENFGILLDYTHKGTFYDAVLLYDDGGGRDNSGAVDDDNHDDLVIGLNAIDVPEPGTVGLLALGLLGLGFSQRRNRTSSQK